MVKENIFKRIANVEKMKKVKSSSVGLAKINLVDLQKTTDMS